MKEAIITNVVIDDNDESELSFHKNNEDIITLKLNDNEICKMDYEWNLKPLIKRILEIWGK